MISIKLTAPTWHNAARVGDIAASVLMPGDPKRATYIAEKYLENAVIVSDVRGIPVYTGTFHGKRVSVMASGMGMPSMAIYSHELYNVYGVRNIVRVGTAGVVSPDLCLMDVVASMACCTDSNYGAHYNFPGVIAPTASFELLLRAHEAAARLGIPLRVGPTMSSDVLYDEADADDSALEKMHLLASEMEAGALYMNAMRAGRHALCLCTIVNDARTGEEASVETRERALDNMIRLALETV